jgi:hypothetical protein
MVLGPISAHYLARAVDRMMVVVNFRWILLAAEAFMLLGAGGANWAVLIGNLTKRKRGSMVPLIGGMGAAIVLTLSPLAWLRNVGGCHSYSIRAARFG